MNVFEYALGKENERFVFDESGNLYIYDLSIYDAAKRECLLECLRIEFGEIWDDWLFLEKEKYENFIKYEIILPPKDSIADFSWVRKPYYRMRGKPVTPEQAFEIIRRTDGNLESKIKDEDRKDFVHGWNFQNWSAMSKRFIVDYGWVNNDGTIGGSAHTYKYPTIDEFVVEWFRYLTAFPYLDLVIAITYWNERPWDVSWDPYKEYTIDDFESDKFDKEFYKAVVCGIYVSGTTVQILTADETISMYKKYNALYGKKSEISE